MDRHFALPIAFAAAFHGAVLFGFSKTPRTEVLRKPVPTGRVPFIYPPPEDVPIILEAGEVEAPKRLPDQPQPIAQPEPPAIQVASEFIIQPPAVVVEGKDLPKIPPMPVAAGNGESTAPWERGILLRNQLDNSPRTRFQPAPIYPPEARREGLNGEVLVEFVVDESGSVVNPRVVRSTHRVFEEASLRAVAKWKFEPGRRDARVVAFRMAVPVVFNLHE
jgi:protein TonB